MKPQPCIITSDSERAFTWNGINVDLNLFTLHHNLATYSLWRCLSQGAYNAANSGEHTNWDASLLVLATTKAMVVEAFCCISIRVNSIQVFYRLSDCSPPEKHRRLLRH